MSSKMYKTVRKGDASLQYTILPQTDVPSLNVSAESSKTVPITKYSVAVVILIIITSLSTAALINQTYFAHTILALPKKLIQSSVTNEQNNKTNVTMVKEKYKDTKNHTTKPAVKLFIETLIKHDRENNVSVTSMDFQNNQKIELAEVVTESSSTLRNILRIPITIPKQISSSSISPMALKTGSPSTTVLPSTVSPRKSKISRITLKLRENETAPQMYMKSVIATNEKGNITTSVVTHGLSLEGLIFKTPHGTIRPWRDSAHNRILDLIISLHPILILSGLITLIAVWVLFYVQRRMMKRQKQNIEESEGDKLEGDNSTLLKADTDDNE